MKDNFRALTENFLMELFKIILERIQQGFTSGNWLHLQGTSHMLIWQEPVQLSSVYSSVVDP
jgi:hypothetical protein